MGAVNILLVDDDASSLKLLTEFFQPLDANIIFTSDSEEAFELIETMNPKLCLVSLKLAHAQEWFLLKQMQENLTPIIGLVEYEQSQWMKEGQLYGISAYLVKPLDFLNLKTYFSSVLSQIWPCRNRIDSAKDQRSCYDRRLAEGRRWYDRLHEMNNVDCTEEGLITAGPFTIDKAKKCVYRDQNNLKLTPKEYALFLLLLKNKEKVVSSDEIISTVWLDNGRASIEDAKQYIYMLRKKIENNPAHPCLIHTVKGVGYMLSCSDGH